jgi:BTB/POZ domain
MNECINKKNIMDIELIMKEMVLVKEKVKKTINSWENALDELDRRAIVYEVLYKSMKETEKEDKIRRDKVESNIKLNLRGKLFDTSKDILLKTVCTYFYLLLSSPFFELDCDGAYFIDRPSIGFDRILKYLNTGALSLEGLNKYDVDCMYDNLDYFKITHIAQIDCSRGSSVEGLRMDVLLQLRDGRLCGRTNDSDIHIWSMDTNMIEMTMKGHTGYLSEIIEHADGGLSIQSYNYNDAHNAKVSNSKTYILSIQKYGKVSREISDTSTDFSYCPSDWVSIIRGFLLFFIVITPISIILLLFFTLLLYHPTSSSLSSRNASYRILLSI